MADAEDVAEGIAGRQRDRGRANDRRIQQEEREEIACRGTDSPSQTGSHVARVGKLPDEICARQAEGRAH